MNINLTIKELSQEQFGMLMEVIRGNMAKEDVSDVDQAVLMNIRVASMDISHRLKRVLSNWYSYDNFRELKTVGDIMTEGIFNIAARPKCGPVTVRELYKALVGLGVEIPVEEKDRLARYFA